MVVAVFDYLMHPNGFLFRIQLRVTQFSDLVLFGYDVVGSILISMGFKMLF